MCFLYRKDVSGIQLALDPNVVKERRKKRLERRKYAVRMSFTI